MMKIFPLSEGSFTIDNSKLFVPFDEEADKLNERKRGSLLVEVQPFLVKTGKDLILLDTGLGFEKEGKLQLLENILNAGFQPGDVTKVLLSHLHKDHAGGIGIEREGLGSRLSIPSARYYLQQDEFNFALKKRLPSYITDELLSLQNNSQVELLSGNGMIDDYIRYEVTGAHSPFHQVFWIKENEDTLFFGADDAPQLQQMKHRFSAKYDFDGKKSMELRQQWWQQGNKENWTFLFYHDIKTPQYKGHQ